MVNKYEATLDAGLAEFFANIFAQTLKQMNYTETMHHLAAEAPQVFLYTKGMEKVFLSLTSMPGQKTRVEITCETSASQTALEKGRQYTVLEAVKSLYSPLVEEHQLERAEKTIQAALQEIGKEKRGSCACSPWSRGINS